MRRKCVHDGERSVLRSTRIKRHLRSRVCREVRSGRGAAMEVAPSGPMLLELRSGRRGEGGGDRR